jgi:hypothetical protein
MGVTQFGSRSPTEFILSGVEGFEMTDYYLVISSFSEKSFFDCTTLYFKLNHYLLDRSSRIRAKELVSRDGQQLTASPFT